MHDYLLSVFLGIVEGLTEFLPVSSTAHLRIAEALLHIDLKNGFWKMYTIVIQLGAIVALTVLFWRRILKFLQTFPRGERGDKTIITHPLSLVSIAFIVTAVPAFLLTKLIGKNLESLYVMSLALLIGGIVMWVVDALFVRPRIQHMEQTTLPAAIWIGAVQTLSAIFQGHRARCARSRRDRLSACRAKLPWNFLSSSRSRRCLSRPERFAEDDQAASRHRGNCSSCDDAASLDGSCDRLRCRFFFALTVVAWFLRSVRWHGFVPFAIYRIVLGLLLLVLIVRGVV